MRLLIITVLMTVTQVHLCAQGNQYYKVTTLQAAPGKLIQLINKVKPSPKAEHRVMRHSQGDQWDLFIMEPVSNPQTYFAKSEKLSFPEELVSIKEEMLVTGPPASDFYSRFDESGFYHIEMFIALPGMKDRLYQERLMENAYLEALNRPLNMIFTNEFGSRWTHFTIGFYRDIKHYAESADISLEEENRAAKIAGFENVESISPYLRSLILSHHDTLAGAVR